MTSLPNDGDRWVALVHGNSGLDEDARRALTAWLAASPDNARDFLRTETVWRVSGGLAEDPRVQQALERLRQKTSFTEKAKLAWWAWAAATAAAVAAAFFVLAPAAFFGPRTTWYETLPGEQRMVGLPDGSTIAINIASRVGVAYSAERRTLTLARGEALFQVAKDARRPFVVRAGRGSVRALGTRFNILMDGAAVTVAVLEGAVEVSGRLAERKPSESPPPRQAVVLRSGESAAYGSSGQLLRADAQQASRERIVAWREGKLRFDAWPLERAVREHNRYAAKPIRFGDDSLRNIQVSGVFRIGDTDAFLSALNQLTGVKNLEQDEALLLIPP